MGGMTPGGMPAIRTEHLFDKLDGMLLELLRLLTADDWQRQTVAPKWRVKDVAAHLLDTQLRNLSRARDGCRGEPPAIREPADLVRFIDRLNDEGVRVYGRLSPRLLTEWLSLVVPQYAAYVRSLDPWADAPFGVSWAGEERSPNWFDVAREYTEHWHHQQQIRLAVGKDGIMTRELYHPVLDCFLRALPFTYRNIGAPPGTILRFQITGDAGGNWFLRRENAAWGMVQESTGPFAAEVSIPQEIAWQIFTKSLSAESARERVTCAGDGALGLGILRMIAIVG